MYEVESLRKAEQHIKNKSDSLCKKKNEYSQHSYTAAKQKHQNKLSLNACLLD